MFEIGLEAVVVNMQFMELSILKLVVFGENIISIFICKTQKFKYLILDRMYVKELELKTSFYMGIYLIPP